MSIAIFYYVFHYLLVGCNWYRAGAYKTVHGGAVSGVAMVSNFTLLAVVASSAMFAVDAHSCINIALICVSITVTRDAKAPVGPCIHPVVARSAVFTGSTLVVRGTVALLNRSGLYMADVVIRTCRYVSFI